MRSGPLCALLWRVLTWYARNQVTLKARHIPGRLSVVADKLSRLDQTTQTEWSLLQEIFKAICNRWHRPVMLQDSPYKRIIPWFWDPVAMSSQVPLSLPNLANLLTQPFNQIPPRNLTNLNLDARLLEPQHSRSRASLRRWQQIEAPQRGSSRSVVEANWTIVTSGASLIRWTSGYHCKVSC